MTVSIKAKPLTGQYSRATSLVDTRHGCRGTVKGAHDTTGEGCDGGQEGPSERESQKLSGQHVRVTGG